MANNAADYARVDEKGLFHVKHFVSLRAVGSPRSPELKAPRGDALRRRSRQPDRREPPDAVPLLDPLLVSRLR